MENTTNTNSKYLDWAINAVATMNALFEQGDGDCDEYWDLHFELMATADKHPEVEEWAKAVGAIA